MNKILFAIFLSLLPHLLLSYSTPLALQLGYMSAVAYESASSIKDWSCPHCHKYKMESISVFYTSDKSLQGFAGYSPGLSSIIVSFRGSNNLENWITNLNTVQTDYPGCSKCYIHKGFYDAYKSIGAYVRGEVSKLKSLYRSAQIMITGHSLGGALASLAAVDIHKNIGNVQQLYTFGQPRVGNQNLGNYFLASIPNTYRLIDYADIVPHLPPANFNFMHFGHEVWYHPRGMQSYSICKSEDPKCADSVSATSLNTDDHSLENYLKLKVGMNKDEFLSQNLKVNFDHKTFKMQELKHVNLYIQKLKEKIQQKI